MSERLALWWQGRSPRERGLLVMMFALIGVVLGWLLVVRPLSDSLDAARARHGAAVVALAEARARLDAGGGAPAPAALPVDAAIGRAAAEAGFAGARIAAQGPARARVTIDAARPQALFGWLARLERSGLVVDRLRAQANADRTLGAEIVVRARGQ
jgi:general secretion pathway protein M